MLLIKFASMVLFGTVLSHRLDHKASTRVRGSGSSISDGQDEQTFYVKAWDSFGDNTCSGDISGTWSLTPSELPACIGMQSMGNAVAMYSLMISLPDHLNATFFSDPHCVTRTQFTTLRTPSSDPTLLCISGPFLSVQISQF